GGPLVADSQEMTACAKLTASASAPRRPSRTSRRQVNNWPTDNPYLRAVADTSRGALALSATIRRFSSGVQRRRAPVWITSSRDTFDIVVCSVIRLCLRGFIPQRKAAVAGGLRCMRRWACFCSSPQEILRSQKHHLVHRLVERGSRGDHGRSGLQRSG